MPEPVPRARLQFRHLQRIQIRPKAPDPDHFFCLLLSRQRISASKLLIRQSLRVAEVLPFYPNCPLRSRPAAETAQDVFL
jgi:hypothetical protein